MRGFEEPAGECLYPLIRGRTNEDGEAKEEGAPEEDTLNRPESILRPLMGVHTSSGIEGRSLELLSIREIPSITRGCDPSEPIVELVLTSLS